MGEKVHEAEKENSNGEGEEGGEVWIHSLLLMLHIVFFINTKCRSSARHNQKLVLTAR
jgi:hypothetical protein